MLHRCKKCSNILKVASVGRGEITSANRCYFRNVTALFTSIERWAKRLLVRFQKDGLLAELQAKTSKGCRMLLFQHHSYMVTLRVYARFLRSSLCKPQCTDALHLPLNTSDSFSKAMTFLHGMFYL